MVMSNVYGAAARLGKAMLLLCLLAMPLRAEQVSIVAFGDSLTQGYGLLDQDGLVPQLRLWLTAQGRDVRVVNAGVSGDTTAGGLARVEWTMSSELRGMILELGANDMLRGTDPAVTRSNLDGILTIARSHGLKVLLVGFQSPGNFGAEYKREFDSIYPELAEKHDVLLMEGFFEGLGSEDPAAAASLLQDDGIHPNEAGVLKVVGALGPHVLELLDLINTGQ